MGVEGKITFDSEGQGHNLASLRRLFSSNNIGFNVLDDQQFDDLLEKYGDVESISKVIIFARLVDLELVRASDLFLIDRKLESSGIGIDNVIGMNKKFLEQLRRLFKNKMTMEQFMLFTEIKNGGLSDNTFEIVSSIIRKGEEGEGGDDRKKDNYSVLSALLSHYYNKMLMTEGLAMGDIKEKIVWFDNLNKNGEIIDNFLEHKNFRDLMQRYRNRRIVALLCKIFGHDNVFEKDLEKVNKKLGFDISYLDKYL